MNIPLLKDDIAIPSGVSVHEHQGEFTVKGPKGEVKRRLYHPHLAFTVSASEIVVSAKDATKREKKMLFTTISHIKNMIQGVTEGHHYKLKVCSGHFPMTVAVKGETLEVKNFLGEAVPRRLKLNPTVKVVVDGAVITVDGVDVEAAGQQAARIEQLCRRVGFDRRIFQDGIYITHKGEHQL